MHTRTHTYIQDTGSVIQFWCILDDNDDGDDVLTAFSIRFFDARLLKGLCTD